VALRSVDGKLVVGGVLVIAVVGAIVLNLATAGPNRSLQALLPSPSGGSPAPTVEVTPTSGPATPGVGVEVEVVTGCGVVPAVDFDGSFWRPGNGRTMESVARRLVAPVDPSTVTLQSPDSALLRTAAGQVVILVRSGLDTARFPDCG
jgi:hypothetical protein